MWQLYAFIIEKCFSILSSKGKFGMIVPISSICTDRMIDYQKLLQKKTVWNSLFAERPSKLFSGAEVQLVITIIDNSAKGEKVSSTSYNKWGSEFRDFLFDSIFYIEIKKEIKKGSFPKIGSEIQKSILDKLLNQKSCLDRYKVTSSRFFVTYRNAGGRYYKVILNYEPEFKVNGILKRSSTYQFSFFPDKLTNDAVCAVMNSTLFFWYWLIYSDTWHMINREIGSFPIELNNKISSELAELNKGLMKDLKKNSVSRLEYRNKGKDQVEFTQYYVRKSKERIDQIDKLLANHFKLSDEELDFILNYDVKYRLAKDEED